jgi:hypothetical protein
LSEASKHTMQTVIQSLQLAVLVIGVAGVFLTIGRRDAMIMDSAADIDELRAIASDLVKASIESTTTNREQDRRLDDLKVRLARLETRP